MNVKSRSRIVFACDATSFRAPRQATLLFCLLAMACATNAQDVLMPRPQYSITPPAMQPYQTNELDVFAPAGTTTGIEQEPPPFQWGPVSLRPHVFYRFLYGDGIAAAQGDYVSTIIQQASPGFLFGIGDHWALDYTPTWTTYSNKQFRDTLDHSVTLTGGTAYEDWVFGLSQSYIFSSTPQIETGTQTDEESYLTAITGSYRFNSKMSMDLALNQSLVSAQDFTSHREWSTLDWLNYQFWPRLDTGVGAGFGYIAVETGSDMTYEQILGRIGWRPTDKISFQIHAGVEDRQFLSGGEGDEINPVAGALIQYQPIEFTKFSLTADRVVATALTVTNSITESTEVVGDLNQRLFEKLYLDLSGGYHNIKYIASGTTDTSRTDNYYTFDVRLSCPFLKRGTVAVFYQYSDNSSTASGFTFTSSQVGFEVGYRF
jgi:hypothetical protein